MIVIRTWQVVCGVALVMVYVGYTWYRYRQLEKFLFGGEAHASLEDYDREYSDIKYIARAFWPKVIIRNLPSWMFTPTLGVKKPWDWVFYREPSEFEIRRFRKMWEARYYDDQESTH